MTVSPRNTPRTVGVIQARMNSSRLPGKVLLPLAGAPLLQRLVERLQAARGLDALVVATTDTPADDPVAALCAEIDVGCHRGDEADVLGRMLAAAAGEDAEVMVRLTADNPMVGGDLVDHVVDRLHSAGPEIVFAHTVDGAGFPYGLFVEAASVTALAEAAREGDADDHEHVTLYLRKRPDRFPALIAEAPCAFTVDHVSIDTPDEYERVRALFEQLYAGDPTFGFAALAAGAEADQAPRSVAR